MPDTTENLSRRAILSAAPSVAAAAAVGVALAMPALAAIAETDPIFAAIERHRTAEAEFSKVCDIEDDHKREAAGLSEEEAKIVWDDANDLSDEARLALAATIPQTMRGVKAVLDYLSEYYLRYGCMISDERELVPLLQSIAASPALSI